MEWASAVVSQEVSARDTGTRDSTVLWRARVDADQGSGRLSTMTLANALLEIPVGTSRVEAGQTVRAHLTDCAEIE